MIQLNIKLKVINLNMTILQSAYDVYVEPVLSDGILSILFFISLLLLLTLSRLIKIISVRARLIRSLSMAIFSLEISGIRINSVFYP